MPATVVTLPVRNFARWPRPALQALAAELGLPIAGTQIAIAARVVRHLRSAA